MNYGGVCRTAPATPGLLIRKAFIAIGIFNITVLAALKSSISPHDGWSGTFTKSDIKVVVTLPVETYTNCVYYILILDVYLGNCIMLAIKQNIYCLITQYICSHEPNLDSLKYHGCSRRS